VVPAVDEQNERQTVFPVGLVDIREPLEELVEVIVLRGPREVRRALYPALVVELDGEQVVVVALLVGAQPAGVVSDCVGDGPVFRRDVVVEVVQVPAFRVRVITRGAIGNGAGATREPENHRDGKKQSLVHDTLLMGRRKARISAWRAQTIL